MYNIGNLIVDILYKDIKIYRRKNTMKKIISLFMAFVLVFSLAALVACDKSGDDNKGTGDESNAGSTAPESKKDESDAGETTPEETTEENKEPEANEFPYEVDDELMPLSITMFQFVGAPTADAQYFVIAPENVIHDGKGTYNNATNTIGTAVFDRDGTTYYDCDENCNYANTAGDSEYGIILEDANWNCETQDEAIEAGNSGYVGAYFEDGITLIQIRYMPRSGATMVARLTGAIFQASTDGKTWVDIGTVAEGDPMDGFFTTLDVPAEYADTVFHYVRMLGRPHDTLDDPTDTGTWSYCNLAEMEIWGKPAK